MLYPNLSYYDDYRSIIKEKGNDLSLTYREIASKTMIHSSYFSRVMQNQANFSGEQLFLIAGILSITGWELDYFLLLGEHNASANVHHKNFILSKIKNIQEERQKIISNIENVYKDLSTADKSLYYQEVVTAKIHMLLTLKRYRQNPSLITKILDISENKLKSELKKLELLKIISRDNKNDCKIEIIRPVVHLEENDPLTPMNHINWRLNTIHHLSKRENQSGDYHLSATFSANNEVKLKIREYIKDLVVKVQKETQKHPSERVYQISFDLYEGP